MKSESAGPSFNKVGFRTLPVRHVCIHSLNQRKEKAKWKEIDERRRKRTKGRHEKTRGDTESWYQSRSTTLPGCRGTSSCRTSSRNCSLSVSYQTVRRISARKEGRGEAGEAGEAGGAGGGGEGRGRRGRGCALLRFCPGHPSLPAQLMLNVVMPFPPEVTMHVPV